MNKNALTKCKDCGNDISKKAKVCQNCGADGQELKKIKKIQQSDVCFF